MVPVHDGRLSGVIVLLVMLQRSGCHDADGRYRLRSESNSPVDRWGTIEQALQHTDVWEQVQCNNAYKALFPGENARDAGPCQAVMASSYREGTCSNDVCRPAVEHMLSACVHWKIPDVPAGNPLAGKPFRIDRAESIRSAMIRAGCQIDFVQLLLLRAPTRVPSPSPTPYNAHTAAPTPVPPTPAPTPLQSYFSTVELWGLTTSTFGRQQKDTVVSAALHAVGMQRSDCQHCAVVSQAPGTVSRDADGAVAKLSSLIVRLELMGNSAKMNARIRSALASSSFETRLQKCLQEVGLHTHNMATRGVARQHMTHQPSSAPRSPPKTKLSVQFIAEIAALLGAACGVVCWTQILSQRRKLGRVNGATSHEECTPLRWDSETQMNLPSLSALMRSLALSQHTVKIQGSLGASTVRDLVDQVRQNKHAFEVRAVKAGIPTPDCRKLVAGLSGIASGISNSAPQLPSVNISSDNIDDMNCDTVRPLGPAVGMRQMAIRPITLHQDNNNLSKQWRTHETGGMMC